jgi:quercetin dioxygenase-like cupin family protein
VKVVRPEELDQASVTMPGAHACKVRWLVGEPDGAPNFAMREFEVAPGGYTPHHSHPYEHEIYVLEGEGVAIEGNSSRGMRAGDVIFVAPDEVHQFRNTGGEPLKFLCLVPHVSKDTPVRLAPECAGPLE